MTPPSLDVALCNGADPPDLGPGDLTNAVRLDYRSAEAGGANLTIGLPDFVRGVFYLPDRLLDLLEIAAYVYCGDRFFDRGDRDAVEYEAWARRLHFAIRVRDHAFWAAPGTQVSTIVETEPFSIVEK
jgi:hypothetical protein